MAGLLASLSACPPSVLPLRPELRSAAVHEDALELADRLEKLIDEQRDVPQDREAAYNAVRQWKQKTAGYAFARAALAGRLAQIKGLTGGHLVAETEKWARYSIGLNPKFRNGAAKRMLATTYVLAPASLLKHGDSEKGLEMLEELVEAYPKDLENHLRLAEGYIALGDPEPAFEELCTCKARKGELRPDSQRLLAKLVEPLKSELECADEPSDGAADAAE